MKNLRRIESELTVVISAERHLLLFQNGFDVPSRAQNPDHVDPSLNWPVEDQVIPESSDAAATKPFQARVPELIGSAGLWHASQR
jgi:hypothetical protein